MSSREPTPREIETFAQQNLKITKTVKERSGPHFLCDCPICGKKQKFYINQNSGLWDCLAGDTMVATRSGVRRIADLSGDRPVLLTPDGWQRCPVLDFGVRQVSEIQLVRDRVTKKIKATLGHRWILKNGQEKKTAELVAGDVLMSVESPKMDIAPDDDGIAAGILFGDGSGNNGAIELYGPKIELQRFFTPSKTTKIETTNGVPGVRLCGLPKDQKSLPSMHSSPEFLLGWLMGYMAADGTVNIHSGAACIDSSKLADLSAVRDFATVVGLSTSPIGSYWRKGFDGYEGYLHRVAFRKSTLTAEFFLRSDHRQKFYPAKKPRGLSWRVLSVAPSGEEPVYCAVVQGSERFALDDNLLTGNCKRCEAGGNLWSLASALGVRIREQTVVKGAVSALAVAIDSRVTTAVTPRPRDAPGRSLTQSSTNCLALGDDDDAVGVQVREYLKSRGFESATIKHFRVGRTTMATKRDRAEPAVQIPYIVDGKVVLTKERNIAADKSHREFRRSKGADSPLFNGEAVKNRKQVVLVEGEIDAMSLWQCGITNVASTSIGAKGSVPQAWLDDLAAADDIVLWYDDDDAGQDAVESLRIQLGTYRCRIASMPTDLASIGITAAEEGWRPSDANDLLQAGVGFDGFKKIIDDALVIEDGNIVNPGHYRQQLESLINNSESHLGLQFEYGCVSRLLRGIRPELTLVTGHTGHGKSTWAIDMLMALNEQTGAAVGLTSYENGSLALARKLFQRILGEPISSIKSEKDRVEAMSALTAMDNLNGVKIVDEYGRSDVDTCCERIREMVKRHQVKAVMIDHLEFILPETGFKKKHEVIDQTLMKLLKLCEELQVAIFLVAHPNGGIDEKSLPTGDNVKGSSGVKQLVENGISVYRHRRAYGENLNRTEVSIKGPTGTIRVELGDTDSYVHVWKTRHDEALDGDGVYLFDRKSLRFADPLAKPKVKVPEPELDSYVDDDDFGWC